MMEILSYDNEAIAVYMNSFGPDAAGWSPSVSKKGACTAARLPFYRILVGYVF
jgi:hypothetical protein